MERTWIRKVHFYREGGMKMLGGRLKFFGCLFLCEDAYFPKGKFKLLNSLFHSVYLVFSIRLISIADLFAVPYLCGVCNEDMCCVVTNRAADILVSSLGLFTFARIACILQL